jgi:hypothetical protein
LYDILDRAESVEMLFTHAGITRLAHRAIYGAFLALLGLAIKSPLRPLVSNTASTGSDTSSHHATST